MSTTIQALLVLLPPAYLTLAVLYGMAFAGERQPALAHVRKPLLMITLVAHAAIFALNAKSTGAAVVGGMRIASATGLCVSLLFLLVTRRAHQPTVAGMLFAVVFLLQLAASAFGPMGPETSANPGNAVDAIHALTMLLATSALVLSGIYGCLYLLLFRQLKSQKYGPLARWLPDMEQLTLSTRSTALAGFIFMTLGVNGGIALAHARGLETFSYMDPTVLLNIGLWVHFGVIAFSRSIPGITARRASIAAMAGLVTLLAAIAILAVPGASFHGGA
ncbi:MAG: ABC-type uncharacterized transport system permease subunit [Planctomycetota bacterium]|jgi:ABC-type uncharacterized transport system permease subunit